MHTALSLSQRQNIEETLKIASSAILGVYDSGDNKTRIKTDNSPVTQADLLSEKIIIDALSKITPEIAVLSEESATDSWSWRQKEDLLWILDPMDGTREFIARNDQFCISLALVYRGLPVAGYLMIPVADEIWYAYSGEGSSVLKDGNREIILPEKKGEPLRVIMSRSHMVNAEKEWLKKTGSTIPLSMHQVGSAIKFCHIAAGMADIYTKLGPINDWDIAAGHLIVTEAGGAMLSTDGSDNVRYNKESTGQSGFFAIAPGVMQSGTGLSQFFI